MYQRSATPALLRRLKVNPVVVVCGPRQCGKTMLVRELLARAEAAQGDLSRTYYTLDNASVAEAAKRDPDGFVAGLPDRVVIDEIQRIPELMLAIKASVDRQRSPGRFLLTGSASPLAIPQLGDSLAGRMGLQPLWPFSRQELAGHAERDLWAQLLDAKWQPPSLWASEMKDWPGKWASWVAQGGYPEAVSRDESMRQEWLRDTLNAILQRDVRELSRIDDLLDMPRLLRAAAARAGGQLSYASIARDVKIPDTSFKRYWAVLDAVFLLGTLPAWAPGIARRLVKAPKIVMRDTGLACAMLGLSEERLRADPMQGGGLLENWVVMEAIKNQGHSAEAMTLYHFRTDAGQEVDLVAETPDGRVVGIEVKGGATVRSEDAKGLRLLQEIAGKNFVRGVIFYGGTEVIPLGERLHAVPLAWWEG